MPLKIAVLYNSDIYAARDWLTSFLDKMGEPIKDFNLVRGLVTTEKENEYLLVSDHRTILGLEFDGYLKSSAYYSLEDIVKTRIKNGIKS